MPETSILVSAPTIEMASGYTVRVRRISAEVVSLIGAQVRRELEAERPQELGDEATEEERAAYTEALAAWDARARELAGRKVIALFTTYVVLNETDAGAVDAYKAAMAAIGVELPAGESDRDIYLWRIVAPTLADQQQLLAFATGARRPAA